MITDIQVDCETLSLRHDAAITEIGAVGWNLHEEKFEERGRFQMFASLDTLGSEFHIDPATLKWRLHEGHSHALEGGKAEHRLMIEMFLSWLDSEAPVRVWTQGGKDTQWLDHACSVYGFPLIRHRLWRDSRTYTDAALHNGKQYQSPGSTPHHDGLLDAQWSAHAVHAAYWARGYTETHL